VINNIQTALIAIWYYYPILYFVATLTLWAIHCFFDTKLIKLLKLAMPVLKAI
jgi:hypothetical protein